MVCIVTTPNGAWRSFSAYALILAALLLASRLPAWYALARIGAAGAFAVLIAAFVPFMAPGARPAGVPWFQPTREGLALFGGIVAKSLLSIACLLLLASTTRFDRLLAGAESAGCPRLVAMVLSFMYRYVFLIADDLMRMVQAKRARGPERRPWRDVAALSSMTGTLFVRSYERAERVYLAMCARGFDGTVVPRRALALAPRDLWCAAAAAACFAAGRIAGGLP